MLQIWKSAIFEGIGSAMLIWLVGITSMVFSMGNSIGTAFGLAFVYAFATALALYVLAPISGGHINPLITLAQMLGGSFPLIRGASYVVSQILGSMVGGAFVRAALGYKMAIATGNGGCVLKPEGSFTAGQAFALEFVAAFILLLLVNGTGIARSQAASHGRRLAPILFGLSVGLLNFATSGFAISHGYIGPTGYPNVCFGLASGIMVFESTHWVYWIPGFVAVIAWGLIERFLSPYEEIEELNSNGMGAFRTEERVTATDGKFGNV
ncbi:aquaporin-like protein [Phakopsora pachyrhizi]|uniref:Aquaporin-like protein n=1 Tax=Phakopsora pachyrhizi TaxID=170000 RepID=A0AAV0B7Y0_PHAPC|nr:aquaporin-like protein [Phakopsora pachyrhizi]KAI8455557.1 aquaporin-like protein [Phakopsora pachyrhizi]CAH7683060.1 aquaporin-like protein [Phakopsora pachyrhizi]